MAKTKPSPDSFTLRLGARGSLLSRMQSQWVANEIEKLNPGVKIELTIIKTTGDKIQDKPLHEAGGKGLFTKELEQALLANEVDFAVHSYKDVPVTMPLVDTADLVIAAVPGREDARDAMVSSKGRSIAQLPQGASVGTGSLRRRCQVLAVRPDLDVKMIRGNVDTRVKKARSGELDAVILAMAGLRRSGLYDDTDMIAVETSEMLPAAAQGALAVQCRRGDEQIKQILRKLHDEATEVCVNLERAVVLALNGDCHSPIAAYATVSRDQLTLRTAIGARGGNLPIVRAEATGSRDEAQQILERVIGSLEKQGARKLLVDGKL